MEMSIKIKRRSWCMDEFHRQRRLEPQQQQKTTAPSSTSFTSKKRGIASNAATIPLLFTPKKMKVVSVKNVMMAAVIAISLLSTCVYGVELDSEPTSSSTSTPVVVQQPDRVDPAAEPVVRSTRVLNTAQLSLTQLQSHFHGGEAGTSQVDSDDQQQQQVEVEQPQQQGSIGGEQVAGQTGREALEEKESLVDSEAAGDPAQQQQRGEVSQGGAVAAGESQSISAANGQASEVVNENIAESSTPAPVQTEQGTGGAGGSGSGNSLWPIGAGQQTVQQPSSQPQVGENIGGNTAAEQSQSSAAGVQASYHYPDGTPPQSPAQPQPQQPPNTTPCGFQTDPATRMRHCYGGWKCGCLAADASDFPHQLPTLPPPMAGHHSMMTPMGGLASGLGLMGGRCTPFGGEQAGGGGAYTGGNSIFGRRRSRRQATTCPGGGMPQCVSAGQCYCCEEPFCFAGDTRVLTSGGSWVRMDELEVGEWIATAAPEANFAAEEGKKTRLGYTQVTSWIHRVPHIWADFVRIGLEDGAATLKLTAKHFIFTTNCEGQNRASNEKGSSSNSSKQLTMVFADQVSVGDCLLVLNEKNSIPTGPGTNLAGAPPDLVPKRVVEITTVRERGIYAPMTANGDLLAEGVLSSVYTLVDNLWMQDAVFESSSKTPATASQVDLPLGLESVGLGWLMDVVLPSSLLNAL